MGTLAFSNAGVLENKSSRTVMHANAPMKDHIEIRHCGRPAGREPEPKKNRPATDLVISIMIRFLTNKSLPAPLLYENFCMYLQKKKKNTVSMHAGAITFSLTTIEPYVEVDL